MSPFGLDIGCMGLNYIWSIPTNDANDVFNLM